MSVYGVLLAFDPGIFRVECDAIQDSGGFFYFLKGETPVQIINKDYVQMITPQDQYSEDEILGEITNLQRTIRS